MSGSFKPSIPWSTINQPLTSSAGPNSKQDNKIPPPSPSSSTLLISPENKILLLRRLKTSSSFPSAHVFPGGNLEASDGALPTEQTNPARHQDCLAYRTGAIRELFEESGILLARSDTGTGSELLSIDQAARLQGRSEVHAGRTRITEWLRSRCATAVLDTDGLIPFSHWVTPTNVPKRFTTQMYVYFVPMDAPGRGQQGTAGGGRDDLLATPDEVETMAPEWHTATEWLRMARGGDVILFPPQFLLLSLVAGHLDRDGERASEVARDERTTRRQALRDFVEGTAGRTDWRHVYISPMPTARWKDGRSVLSLDYAGVELKGSGLKGNDEWVVLVKFAREGPTNVEVMRRDDVEKELARAKNEKETRKKKTAGKL